jgi:hypothetical protein
MKKLIFVVLTLLFVITIKVITYAGKTKKDLSQGKYKLVCTDSIQIEYPKSFLPQGVSASHLTRVVNGYIWKGAGIGSYHQFDLKGKLLHSYTGQYKLCPDDNAKSYKKIPLRVGSIAISNKYVYVYDDLTQYWFVYDIQGNFIKRMSRFEQYKHSAILGSQNILNTNDTILFIPVTQFDTTKRYSSPIVYMIHLRTGKTVKKFLEPDSMIVKYKERIGIYPSTLVPLEIDFSQKELYTAHNHSYLIHKYSYVTGQKILTFGQQPPGYHSYIPKPVGNYRRLTVAVRDTITAYNIKNWHYSPVLCYNAKNKLIARTIYSPLKPNRKVDSYLQIYNSVTGELITQIQLPDKYYNLCHITDDLEFWIENQKISRDTPYIIYKVKLVPDN